MRLDDARIGSNAVKASWQLAVCARKVNYNKLIPLIPHTQTHILEKYLLLFHAILF